MTSSGKIRCENLACFCEVRLTEKTCSDYCASFEGRDPHNIRCECGHAPCKTQTERQLSGSAGEESLD